MKDDRMHPDGDDYADQRPPIVIAQGQSRGSVWASITRAVVSFTLLAVLLLAFGVAISAWFVGTRVNDDLVSEIDRTPVQAQIVIAYRDALLALTDEMSSSRVVLTPPDESQLYDQVIHDRHGRGGLPSGADSLQSQIDLLQRDNADLRWVNQRLLEQAALSRNPPLPRRNDAP
jgi:hypothetical protein